jgi:hypothetical protein
MVTKELQEVRDAEPKFKSNSASRTFHNSGADILKAINEKNRKKCSSSKRGRHFPANDDQLELWPT